MGQEPELKNTNSLQKEFQNLLDKDFKDRKLKENEIIKATVTEITKNFVVVDCKAKMEGMIPIEEFKNDEELAKLKVGSQIEVYLERIESFKGEIIISRPGISSNISFAVVPCPAIIFISLYLRIICIYIYRARSRSISTPADIYIYI